MHKSTIRQPISQLLHLPRYLTSIGILLAAWAVIPIATAHADLAFESAGRSTIGFVRDSGMVEAANRATIGFITANGTVENVARHTLGYLRENGVAENAGHATIGHFQRQGDALLLENANHGTIGMVHTRGTIENARRSTCGFIRGTVRDNERSIAAYLFFFAPMLLK